jgi:hypothetical protein
VKYPVFKPGVIIMADQTIKPVLPVIKPRNTLHNKKVVEKDKQPADRKSAGNNSKKKKGGIDTYA